MGRITCVTVWESMDNEHFILVEEIAGIGAKKQGGVGGLCGTGWTVGT